MVVVLALFSVATAGVSAAFIVITSAAVTDKKILFMIFLIEVRKEKRACARL